ncbi:hypothetical protein AQUCO_02200056v1 [Aquilegia coerulea]|uniref:PHD-type domain-containing protein n=1 Tax=Aquilegia coerulea TaxID=218851 RepID=A0A2G5DCW1_AQUCA|nr:hypothetical protein AQUCO_02200056v1 [Aquilegia coerulea]
MEPKFHGVHPLKRFKLQQQEEQSKKISTSARLPAKKRKESRDSLSLPFPLTTTINTVTTCSLPAKKRIWAFQPILDSPEKPDFSFDLNLDYQQSSQEEPTTPTLVLNKKLEFFDPVDVDSVNKVEEEIDVGIQCREDSKETAEEEEEEDDDGILCGVCQSTDGDPSDPIVFCDGCDLMVHATCYGDPLIEGIPEGDWFCATCQVSSPPQKIAVAVNVNEIPKGLSCCLCPVKGGVMKPTTDGKWAHILCALLVPEVFFKNPEGREGIDCSLVPQKRWKEICYVCKSRNGCAIECSEPKCLLAFHVTCGLNEELYIEYKEGRHGKEGDIVAGFCKTHTQMWEKQEQTGKFKIVAREEHKKSEKERK